ncbi:spermatogenesis-associated protein 13 [Geranomyces michiganensis]|nr:spermatogenesis-associated protein 13 [Geranomyces michiganensis]
MSPAAELLAHASRSASSLPPKTLAADGATNVDDDSTTAIPAAPDPPPASSTHGPFEALLLRHIAASSAPKVTSSPDRPSSEQSNYQTCSSPADSTPPASQPSYSPVPHPSSLKGGALSPHSSPSPWSTAMAPIPEDLHALELPPAAPPLPVSNPSSPGRESVDISIPTPSPRPPVSPSASQQSLSDSTPSPPNRGSSPSRGACLKPPSIRTDRDITRPRPVSLAVGFSIGATYDDDHSGDESSPDSAAEHRKAARLSYNGHQKDHLAALHRFAKTSPSSSTTATNSPGSASPPAESRSPDMGFFDRLNAVSWVPSEKKFSLMRNASELYRFQQEFLTNLEMCVGTKTRENEDDVSCAVANVFIEMQQRFKVYSQYCTQHDGAIKTLNEYESRPEMVTFLKDFRGLAQTKLDVKDYLIKPVQRLCRYPLLISELMKHSIVDSVDLETLVAAHAVMQNVALEIDSAKWRMDNLERTNRFFSRLEPAPSPANDLPRRLDVGDFILAGALFVINSDQCPSKLRYRGVFLFPEYIYVVKPRRMTSYTLKVCLALSSCEFRSLNPGESPLPNAWRLINTDGGQVYDFCSTSERERTAWTNMLAQLAAPARQLSLHPFIGTVNTLASPSSPIATSHSVTEFFDSLRRTSSAGSMAGMHDDAIAAASAAAARPQPATHSAAFQRKKFWRQSTAEVRFDMYTVDQPPMPGTSAAAGAGTVVDSTPSVQPNAYYHPVTGLVRRGSVDLRILDVCTPLLGGSSKSSAVKRSPSHQQLADVAGAPLPTQKSVPDLNGLHRSILMSSDGLDSVTHGAYPTPDEMPVFDRKHAPYGAASTGSFARKKPVRGYSEAHVTIKRNSRSFAPGMDYQIGSLLENAQQRLLEQSYRRPQASGRPTHYRDNSISSNSSSGTSQVPLDPAPPVPPPSVMAAPAAEPAHHHQYHQQRSNSDSKASAKVKVDLRRTATTTTTQSAAAAAAAAAQNAAYAIPPRSTSFTASAPLLNRYPSRSSLSSWISGRSSQAPPAAFTPPPLPAPPHPPPPPPPPSAPPPPQLVDDRQHPFLIRSNTMTSALSAVTAPLPRSLMPDHPSGGWVPARASMDPRSRRRESQFYQNGTGGGVAGDHHQAYMHPLRHSSQVDGNGNINNGGAGAGGGERSTKKRQNVLRRTWSQIFHTGRQIKGALGRRSSKAPPPAANATTPPSPTTARASTSTIGDR